MYAEYCASLNFLRDTLKYRPSRSPVDPNVSTRPRLELSWQAAQQRLARRSKRALDFTAPEDQPLAEVHTFAESLHFAMELPGFDLSKTSTWLRSPEHSRGRVLEVICARIFGDCGAVAFVPESSTPTPDLRVTKDGQTVAVEVTSKERLSDDPISKQRKGDLDAWATRIHARLPPQTLVQIAFCSSEARSIEEVQVALDQMVQDQSITPNMGPAGDGRLEAMTNSGSVFRINARFHLPQGKSEPADRESSFGISGDGNALEYIILDAGSFRTTMNSLRQKRSAARTYPDSLVVVSIEFDSSRLGPRNLGSYMSMLAWALGSQLWETGQTPVIHGLHLLTWPRFAIETTGPFKHWKAYAVGDVYHQGNQLPPWFCSSGSPLTTDLGLRGLSKRRPGPGSSARRRGRS